ncbi:MULTISPECIES: hypothetical protein [Nostoc]|uniref:Uncharacterized protein n=2 Tax=Nostoc TaxID=1177 RepID=A0ABR8I9C2_9NOSO|nr:MULTISPECIES: hypothetical protein [Nostoc]MBD2562109.1 hypothetical protein [Nostoc linckia FACHB-391]MBD2647511.1 hypothetical protein [Nostoc foliaceum FACHB-393]
MVSFLRLILLAYQGSKLKSILQTVSTVALYQLFWYKATLLKKNSETTSERQDVSTPIASIKGQMNFRKNICTAPILLRYSNILVLEGIKRECDRILEA